MRVTILCILSLGVASAVIAESPAGDPVLGERLVEGVATEDSLWVRSANGALVHFDRATGDRKVLSTHGVADIVRYDERTVALIREPNNPGSYRIQDTDTGEILAPIVSGLDDDDGLISLVHLDQGWAILSRETLILQEQDHWRRAAVDLDRPSFGADVTLAVGQNIYVGRNRGEWGGGLGLIEAPSARAREIARVDGEGLCDGPLNTECDPVTGLARESGRPGCVLASIGLMHMMAHGRILRVCGDRVEVVFEEAVPPPTDPNVMALPNQWPFFGIAATENGWVAVSAGKLFQSSGGFVSQTDMPELVPWQGLEAAFLPSIIILKTDLNWGMSISGYTPLLVPVMD